MSKKIITHNNGIVETRETFYTEKTIQQLKQQLEEKDEQIKKRVMVYEEQFIEQTNEIYSLKQQLAEKDCRIEELEGQFAYECECNKQLVELQKQLAEKDKEINSLIVDYEKRISQEQELMSNMEHQLAEKQNEIDEINKEFVQAVKDWKTLCSEKDKEIEELKKWQEWYSFWHENFKKQIEDLTTELETYRPTKLHGNGQCKCFNCNAINWTDWCCQYKGHIYCNKCLKDILKEERSSQTQLAIQELEKVKELVKDKSAWQSPFGLLKIQESDVEQIIDQQINDLRGE